MTCCGQANAGYQTVWQLRAAPGQPSVLEFNDQHAAEAAKKRHGGGIVMRVQKLKTR